MKKRKRRPKRKANIKGSLLKIIFKETVFSIKKHLAIKVFKKNAIKKVYRLQNQLHNTFT